MDDQITKSTNSSQHDEHHHGSHEHHEVHHSHHYYPKKSHSRKKGIAVFVIRHKKTINFFSQIFFNVLFCILYFVRFYRDDILLPSGGSSSSYYTSTQKHSIFQKMGAMRSDYWIFVGIFFAFGTIATAIYNRYFREKTSVKTLNYIFCTLSVVVFTILLAVASTINFFY